MKIFLGYSRKSYTNKKGEVVNGYELYFANQISDQEGKGYSPALKFNQARKTWQNWFISDRTFENIPGITKLVGKAVNVYLDPDFGNIASITAI